MKNNSKKGGRGWERKDGRDEGFSAGAVVADHMAARKGTGTGFVAVARAVAEGLGAGSAASSDAEMGRDGCSARGICDT